MTMLTRPHPNPLPEYRERELVFRTVARVLAAALVFWALAALSQRAAASDDFGNLRLTRLPPLEFVTAGDLDPAEGQAIRDDLVNLGRRLHEELAVPQMAGPVRIYLFETFDDFQQYVRREVPALALSWADAQREGLFLLRNGRPYIFAFRSPKLTEMLRHEFVHATLNTSHKDVPIWIDEGLAEYYKHDDPAAGDADHAALLRKKMWWRWQPDLPRLESLEQMQQMGSTEYAEAWAWVHFLQQGPAENRGLLRQYLAELRGRNADASLAAILAPHGAPPAAAWKKHVKSYTFASAKGKPWWR